MSVTPHDSSSSADANPLVAAIDEVVVDIDYEIIEHFSQNLYASPNKAVEELVANGYDALAKVVYVYAPGPKVGRRLVVWDDGLSMDVEGLKELWHIAHSPKAGGARTVQGDGVASRSVIGKFGIGKLASYQVGQRITHLCRRGDRYLLVQLDYRAIRSELGDDAVAPHDARAAEGSDGAPSADAGSDDREPVGVEQGDAEDTEQPSSNAEADGEDVETAADPVLLAVEAAASGPNPGSAQGSQPGSRFRAPIVELDEDAARRWAESNFIGPAEVFGAVWGRPNWTLAVVDALKDIELPSGRLRWVLGNGMPLRPDFKVLLDDEAVISKLGTNADVRWQFDEPKLLAELRSEWSAARDAHKVSGEPEDGAVLAGGDGGTKPAVRMPALGEVAVEVSLFPTSLAQGVAAEHGRSHGFFVMVRDRLLNPDDAQFGFADPTFGVFYRTQFVIHVDGLDEDLLANREQLRPTTRTSELAVLQRALYLAARKELDRRDTDRERRARTESLLPVGDSEHFREPLGALLVKQATAGEPGAGFDLSAPRVIRTTLDVDAPLAVLAEDGSGFQVNDAHPFFAALSARLRGGQKAREALRAFDLVAISERLLEGHLFDTGLPAADVDAVLAWRDGLFRALAEGYSGAQEDVVQAAIEASYAGDEPFETALADLLRAMGFEATRDGAPGEKDVLVIAPLGPGAQRFTVEAKGSQGEVTNERAVVASAAGHRDKTGASHAVIVAREFSGFKNREWPAILEECEAVGRVSIVTLESLIALFRAVRKFFYPLGMLLPILEVVETPAAKLSTIQDLEAPAEALELADLLQAIWERQGGEAAGDPVPFRAIHQAIWKPLGMDFDDFKLRLVALSNISRGLMQVNQSANEVVLLQSPEIIADAIGTSLGKD